MKRSFSWMVVLMLVLSLAIAPGLFGQIKQDPQSKLDRLDGNIQSIDKKNMTLILRQRGTSNLDYTVVFNDKTIVTDRNKKGGTIADLKEGQRIITLGKAEGATKLIASRIDIR
jgi:predicted small lipoprotein YifL